MRELLDKLRFDTELINVQKIDLVKEWESKYFYAITHTTQSKEELTSNNETLKILTAEVAYYNNLISTTS